MFSLGFSNGRFNRSREIIYVRLRTGKKFLDALEDEKIKEEDISQEVPIAVTMLLQGPTDEFGLGRIFQAAYETALDGVYETGNEHNSHEVQKIIAGNEFRDGNCQLIGK